MNDATTFFLAFLAVFGGLAAYLWHLDRAARRLEARLVTLESVTAKPKPGDGPGGSSGDR
ncbi:MAG TPA: CcmD family protein [Candidatus Thermoplasmatota archaeon]|nr:CcmD family protein [Candidatus Thermoplasmatota archaeon]